MLHVALSAHFWGQPATGSGQYLHQLVETFGRHHPELRVTLILDEAAVQRAAPPKGVEWVVARTPWDGRSANLAKVWWEQVAVPRAAARVGADLLHVPYFAAPARSGVPVIVTVHDLIPMLLPAYRGGALVRGYTALVARTARRAAHILADSEASRRDILHLLQVPPGRVETVYLAVDAAFTPQPPEAVREIRARLALPDRFALYLGGFDARKGVPGLLHAVAASEGGWPLVVAGRLPAQDTPFTPAPRRVARALGIEERVHFTGWVEEADKPALLTAADLFVFPSEYEGFGLPILEAMACGTATVTTDVSSLPELAGDAAALVPPGDDAALVRTLDRLMADDAARAALAMRGPTQAARFSWQRCAAETVHAYARVVGG